MNQKTKDYINRLEKIHPNYDFSTITNINNQKEKIPVICNQHGLFYAVANHLLEGHGCRECQNELLRRLKSLTSEEFQHRLDSRFGSGKYILQSEYINNHTKVDILCTKCNTVFTRIPSAVLNGIGCPKCENSSSLEITIRNLLLKLNFDFVEQYRTEWLGKQSLDFYLPTLNLAIECQGDQHFIAKNRFGNEEGLAKIQERDLRKRNLCSEHNISLIYFSPSNLNFPYDVYTEKQLSEYLMQLK